MNKWALKLATANSLERYLIGHGLFETTESIPKHYIAKVRSSFTSPRILNTTLLLNRFLSKNYQGISPKYRGLIFILFGEIKIGAILLQYSLVRLMLFPMVIIFLLAIQGRRLLMY